MLALLFFCSAIAAQVAALDCYTPNGTSRNLMNGYSALQLYAPCNAGATHSMCCKFGSSVISGADRCIEDNMFCQSSGGDIWRESCTDPTWQDPACKKLFVNGTGYSGEASTNSSTDSGQIVTDVLITLCDDGVTYCSGSNNRACCVAKQGVYLDSAGIQRATNPNATSTITTSATPTSAGTGTPSSDIGLPTTSNPTVTSTPIAASSSSGLSTGAKAGIGAGVAVAAVAAIGVVAFLLVRRKRRQSQPPFPTSAHDGKPLDPHMMGSPDTTRPVYEAPAYSAAAEKGDRNQYTHRVELEGSGLPRR